MNLDEMFESSKALINFETEDEELLSNGNFLFAWELLMKKSLENISLIKALLILQKKYNINEFEFNLILEDFDEEEIL
jgi:hypothetical protein